MGATLAVRRRRLRFHVASILLALFALPPDAPVSRADESPASTPAPSVILNCLGRASEGSGPPWFASAGEATFTVTATFGEGATVALIDPETSAVLKPLYDAETTIGHLKFSDGEETTVVWTRMSGADGGLMGAAILSDGDVLTLTIDPASPERARRPFVLFAAASASLARGTCAVAKSG